MKIRRIFGKPLMNLAEWLLLHRFIKVGSAVASMADYVRWNSVQRQSLKDAWRELEVELKIKGHLPRNRPNTQ